MLRSRSNSVSVVQIGISFLESKFDEDLFKKSHSKGINHTISNHISLRVLELLFWSSRFKKKFHFPFKFWKKHHLGKSAFISSVQCTEAKVIFNHAS